MTDIIAEENVRAPRMRKPVGLALQGGGSWGAYTWGVLDALLASRSISIAQLSGTSAGAINAAIVASAIAEGKPAEARRRLRSFWLAVAKPAVADFGREWWGPVERHWRETVGTWLVASTAASPYQTNPLGLNPLRDAIAAHVDIDAIRSKAAPPLYVTLTNVKSGLPRVISNDTMTIDALLASACLPQLFQAVEIDGEPYWDGGYSGNPTLWPMIQGGPARDLIVVQLTPDAAADVPKDAAAIRRRVGEIVFHSSLVAEMQAITAMRTVAAQGEAAASVLNLRMHRIGPPRGELFEQGSALERSRAWIDRLYDEGRHGARRFLARHGRDIGVRETLDIAKVFSAERKPKLHLPANEAAFDPQPAPVRKSAPVRAAGGGHA
jgi:NTE family protein